MLDRETLPYVIRDEKTNVTYDKKMSIVKKFKTSINHVTLKPRPSLRKALNFKILASYYNYIPKQPTIV